MQKYFSVFILSLCFCSFLSAQEIIFLHQKNKTTPGALVSKVDSLKFSSDASTIQLYINNTKAEYLVADLDSIDFSDNSDVVYIRYEGNTASVLNPLAFEGVSVEVSGADVIVRSTIDRQFGVRLSGTTDNGSFKIYSSNRFNLTLDGVSLTNQDGPAINIQSKKEVDVSLSEGKTNILSDGTTYAEAPMVAGVPEDQSAAFFSEGQLIFNDNGNLVINGRGIDKHALASDDYIHINSGTITVNSAAKDGIHCSDGYEMQGGTVNLTTSGDGIDGSTGYVRITGGTTIINCTSAGADGICCDSTLTVQGGNIVITTSGAQSKGIKSTQAMVLSGGNITINASGGVTLVSEGSGYNPSYCAGIKCDAGVTVNGATIQITHTGISGKGISTNTFDMTSGSLTIAVSGAGDKYTNTTGVLDAYSAGCITTDGSLSLLGGTVYATSSGLGGKGFSSDGYLTIGTTSSSPTIYVETSNNAIYNGATSLTEPKAIKCDTTIYLVNGTVSINAAGEGEAIDTKGSIYMTGGTVIAQGPPNGTLTRCIDYYNAFDIHGGTFIACGPYRSKLKVPSAATSTQNCIYAYMSTITATLPAGTLFNLQDASKNSLITFKPLRDCFHFIVSTPAIQKNKTYSIYTGGSSTGSNTNGLYTGGTYSSGSLKKTFTTSATSTRTITNFGL